MQRENLGMMNVPSEGSNKAPMLNPQAEWERAFATMNQAQEELAMIREKHSMRTDEFQQREYELTQIVAAGKSVTEHLANWAPQETHNPSPNPDYPGMTTHLR